MSGDDFFFSNWYMLIYLDAEKIKPIIMLYNTFTKYFIVDYYEPSLNKSNKEFQLKKNI